MQLALVQPDWILLIPELFVLGTAILVLAGDVFLPRRQQPLLAWLALIGLAGSLASNLLIDWNAGKTTFSGMFRADYFSLFVNIIVLSAGLMSIMIATSYVTGNDEPGNMPLPEYLVLLLFSILGTMLVGASGDLLMIFIGIEMSSLAVYVLTGFARNRITSIEGALKYFLLGAFASAILIYGMAWVYGATGTTNLSDISARLQPMIAGESKLEPSCCWRSFCWPSALPSRSRRFPSTCGRLTPIRVRQRRSAATCRWFRRWRALPPWREFSCRRSDR